MTAGKERALALAAGPVVVTRARLQQGWSADEVVDHSDVRPLEGRTFRALRDAVREADAATRAFYRLTYKVGGRVYEYDSSYNAGIPGRHVPMVREAR